MAKFRTNHSRGEKGASGNIVKVGIFSAVIGGLFFLFNQFTGGNNRSDQADNGSPREEVPARDLNFLPETTTAAVIHHQFYSLSYSEDDEQAEWVAYKLTSDRLSQPWVDRHDFFMPDPLVQSGSSTPDDYKGSGYDRGHLVPAADMAFSEEAMKETFYMSNISPQSHNFNGGIWRELEELTRSWAKRFDELYVVTGPVLTYEPKGYLGENEVAIPQAYFKVLLDLSSSKPKGIGFVIPNEVSYDPIYKFATSIDRVGRADRTGFLSGLIGRGAGD